MKKFILWLARLFKVELPTEMKKHIVENSVLDFKILECKSEINRFDLEKSKVRNEVLRSIHLEAIDELKIKIMEGDFIEVITVDDAITGNKKFLYRLRVAKPITD